MKLNFTGSMWADACEHFHQSSIELCWTAVKEILYRNGTFCTKHRRYVSNHLNPIWFMPIKLVFGSCRDIFGSFLQFCKSRDIL